MDTGHITPEPTWLQSTNSPARTTCAPGFPMPDRAPPACGLRQGSEWISRSMAWFRTSCVDALVSTGQCLLTELDKGGEQGLLWTPKARSGRLGRPRRERIRLRQGTDQGPP